MDEIIKDNTDAGMNHPLVIALGSRGNVSQVFVTVEGHAMCVQHGVVSAVDRMLKLYFILNMEYPDESRHVLHFLQRQVLAISDERTLSRGGSDLALFIKNKRRKV